MNHPAHPGLGRTTGLLCVGAAAVLWATGGVFAKAPIFQNWDETLRGPMLAFWRSLFAAMLLAPLIRRPRWRLGLIPMAAGYAANSICYLSAMALTTAANTIWLQSTCPWWVFLIGLLLLREKPAKRDFVPLLFAAAGVGLILMFELPGQDRAGAMIGLASGIAFAVTVVMMRHLRHEQTVWLVTVGLASTALVLLPWMIVFGTWPSPWQIAVLVLFGAVQMAAPYVLISLGLKSIGAQEAATVCLLEPVLTPLLVLLAWGERPAWWTAVGAGFILAGLLLRYVGFGQRTAVPPAELPVEFQ